MQTTRGFTLIELMVVIAIIGLLSSVVLASLSTARQNAKDATRVSTIREMQNALEIYAIDHNNQYPNSGNSWRSSCSAWGSYAPTDVIPGISPTYLSQVPNDPDRDASGNTCCFLYNSNATDYKILFHNCPTSNKCYGSGEASGGFPDPARPTWSCAAYTPGASSW